MFSYLPDQASCQTQPLRVSFPPELVFRSIRSEAPFPAANLSDEQARNTQPTEDVLRSLLLRLSTSAPLCFCLLSPSCRPRSNPNKTREGGDTFPTFPFYSWYVARGRVGPLAPLLARVFPDKAARFNYRALWRTGGALLRTDPTLSPIPFFCVCFLPAGPITSGR